MNNLLKKVALLVPPIKRLKDELDSMREGYRYVPPGHFYSPIPSIEEVKGNESILWGALPKEIDGVNLNTEEQLQYFEDFVKFYKEMPFTSQKHVKLRYYFENLSYSYSDAICLYSMIRKLKPQRVIEVGSGFSSCVMMDTNELFFNDKMKITFCDPYPELLLSLMKNQDKTKYNIIPRKVQEVDLSVFAELNENDILFIDSTHVSKIGSDVNKIFFHILPNLRKGVFIHFHDIFYPFEYPREWVFEGRAWNEVYILRAFLQFNNCFKIVFFNTYLEHFYKNSFEKGMPLCMKNTGGSIWLEKIK
jgi:hypothetical protein